MKESYLVAISKTLNMRFAIRLSNDVSTKRKDFISIDLSILFQEIQNKS
jgi:hypothetical protein